MTDDEILKAADVTRARRRNDAWFKAFLARDKVMVRWNLPYNVVARESYTSVMIERAAIQELVRGQMGELSAG